MKKDIAKSAIETCCDLEQIAEEIDGLAHAVILASSSVSGPEVRPLMTLGRSIRKAAANIDETYGQLFKLLHPNREQFEREGWPGEEPESKAA